MKIALAQLNPIIGDFAGNARKIIDGACKAQSLGCDLVIFPELAVSGYPPRDLLEKRDFIDANLAWRDRIVSEIQGVGAVLGYVDRNRTGEGKPLHNAAVLCDDGRIIGTVFKQLLPTYDVFDEQRHFAPGTEAAIFAYKDRRIGVTICEDVWNDGDWFQPRLYRQNPVAELAQQGADLMINISASVFHVLKHTVRRRILSAIAAKYKLPLVHVNQVGGNDSVLFDGVSMAFNATGDMQVRAAEFAEDLVVAELADGNGGEVVGGPVRPVSDTAAASVLEALVMGTRDYVCKCGFERVVIGLSGGIDSALTASIAVQALGAANVALVFMPSSYTSRDNYDDTRDLAKNLGCELTIFPIDEMFAAFTAQLSPDFDPADPAVTEQNIQARIRGTILMALSNRNGSLVLSTGNKSELAVGYCTLYGDMNGGLAVISDVPKTMVYELSNLINARWHYIPPRIIDKAPSAELKPDQTDQDDLPSYDVLDAILKGYVEELQSVNELVSRGFDRQQVLDVIARVDRNEYKRYQAAPGLKVTSKAFGYGRRYPIAQRYRPVNSES
jgi:NAD+ synthetase